ncbi:MAG: radical SAM protein [Chloroflexota bacterium]
MDLTGLHLILTYQCTSECDHCFVWGSPWQSGTMSYQNIENILSQANDLGTVTQIYFEGGEPFLYYPLLVKGVSLASEMGFQVGIVTNTYWASSVDDATLWLDPFAGVVSDLSVSSDLYHYTERISMQSENVRKAAELLGIPIGVISIAQPGEGGDDIAVMYRGRAVSKLADKAVKQPWSQFSECPHEDLRDPGRLHIDPYGNIHLCQGILLGNMFDKPLMEIWDQYQPESHPICGPILAGGPAALVREFKLDHGRDYADACHLCYQARESLRHRFPLILGPDQVYGLIE